MENPDQQQEQVTKYLSNELDIEEKALVEEWIGQSEENRQYVDQMSKLLKLVSVKQAFDTINVDQEWARMQAVISRPSISPDHLTRRTEGMGIVRRMVIGVSVAASLLLLAGAGWKFFTAQKTEAPALAKTKTSIAERGAVSLAREVTNYAASPKTLHLEDGSVVILSPKSTVRFNEPFTDNRRDIVLSGEADFKVAKDKSKPFTVFSGEISTTALGTQFTVKVFPSDNNITVKLYEGKVVVKKLEGVRSKTNEDVYLLPGEQLIYSMHTHTGSISSFEKHPVTVDVEADDNNKHDAGDEPSVSADNAPWYMFNNQALPVVFEQLKEMYQVDIVYTKADLRKMYFIGKFHRTDSVETILEQIGALNRLKVTKTNNKFLVEKIK